MSIPSSAPDLMSWLVERSCTPPHYVKLNPSVPATTHYRMDGGKLAVDPLIMEQFLRQYALALGRGEVLSFVERRTEIYKMHYDLDVLDMEPWNEAHIVSTLQEIRTAMATCFPEDKGSELFRTVVLTAPPKKVNDMWKTGIHVIYPDLNVDSTMGLTLRKVAVMRLNRLQRRLEPLNSWDDVLDRTVHVANGLRMVGSVKMSKCLQCASKRKKMKQLGFDKVVLCDECSGKTMVNDGRAYTALLMLTSMGEKDVMNSERLRQDLVFCVNMSSIRHFDPLGSVREPSFQLPLGIGLEDATAKHSKLRGNLTVSRKEFGVQDKNAMKGNNRLMPLLEEFITSSPLMLELKFNTPFNPYKDVSVIKVSYNKTKSKMSYLVNIEGPGATYCLNKGGHHNSSHVYFLFHSKYVVQRCFCPKTPSGEGAMPCKEFVSRKVVLPADITKLLFPQDHAKGLNVSVQQLKHHVENNMLGCENVKAPSQNKKKKTDMFLQKCWQNQKKQVDYLNHIAITSSLECVPLSQEKMYPSRVSSQLCKLSTAQVENASAWELSRMTNKLVMDLYKNEAKEDVPEPDDDCDAVGLAPIKKKRRLQKK